jgi:hypothetical protein
MTESKVYLHNTVWLKDDEAAGNPPFMVAAIEPKPERGMPAADAKLILRQIDTERGTLIGVPVEASVDEVLTKPPATDHTRAVGTTGEIRIEVVHMRDPDGYDEPTFYVNGQPVSELSNVEVTFFSIDCGAGRDFSDHVENARFDRELASPRVWAELSRYYAEPAGDEYMDGVPAQWPDGDDDWIAHLDEPDSPQDGHSPYWAALWGIEDEEGNRA